MRGTYWWGPAAIIVVLASAAVFVWPGHVLRHSHGSAKHERVVQPPTMTTGDSLDMATSVLAQVRQELATAQGHYIAGVDSTASNWNAYDTTLLDTLSTTRDSLRTFVAAADSLDKLANSLTQRLDQSAALAWVLAHGKDVMSRQETRRTPGAKDKAGAKISHHKTTVPADTASVAVRARFAGNGVPIRPGLRHDGDINPR